MDKKDFKNKAVQAGNWLADTTRNAIEDAKNDLYNEGYDKGQAAQRKRDVNAAILAFLELKVKDHEIYKLLSDYFDIDSISEASDRLFSAKMKRQIQALRKYCESQGMSSTDFRSYAKEHNLEERLAEDKRLLEMSPEKLKSILDRD